MRWLMAFQQQMRRGAKMEKQKRACRVCGQVHKNCPFTDCYSEETDGQLPDDLQSAYTDKFGE